MKELKKVLCTKQSLTNGTYLMMSEHRYSQGCADQCRIWSIALDPDLPEKRGPQCTLED